VLNEPNSVESETEVGKIVGFSSSSELPPSENYINLSSEIFVKNPKEKSES